MQTIHKNKDHSLIKHYCIILTCLALSVCNITSKMTDSNPIRDKVDAVLRHIGGDEKALAKDKATCLKEERYHIRRHRYGERVDDRGSHDSDDDDQEYDRMWSQYDGIHNVVCSQRTLLSAMEDSLGAGGIRMGELE